MISTVPRGSRTARALAGRSGSGTGTLRGLSRRSRWRRVWSISLIVKPISVTYASTALLPRSARRAEAKASSCSVSSRRRRRSWVLRQPIGLVRPVAKAECRRATVAAASTGGTPPVDVPSADGASADGAPVDGAPVDALISATIYETKCFRFV